MKDSTWSNEMLNKKKEKWNDGIYTGPHAPFGYCIKKTPYRHLEVDKRSSEVVKLMFNLISNGYTVNQLMSELNNHRVCTPNEYMSEGYIYITKNVIKKEWTHKMVMRVLQNKVYMGCLEHGKKMWTETEGAKKQIKHKEPSIVLDTHEKIVNKEQFDKVQRNIEKGTTGSVLECVLVNYEGSLYCGVCGKKLRKKIRGKYIYYGCLDSMKNHVVIKGCKGVMIERIPLLRELERLNWALGDGDLVMVSDKDMVSLNFKTKT